MTHRSPSPVKISGVGGTVHGLAPFYAPVITTNTPRATAPLIVAPITCPLFIYRSISARIGPAGPGFLSYRGDTDTTGGGVGDKATPKTAAAVAAACMCH